MVILHRVRGNDGIDLCSGRRESASRRRRPKLAPRPAHLLRATTVGGGLLAGEVTILGCARPSCALSARGVLFTRVMINEHFNNKKKSVKYWRNLERIWGRAFHRFDTLWTRGIAWNLNNTNSGRRGGVDTKLTQSIYVRPQRR